MIHPSAIVDSTAEIGDGVEIGPYSIIGKEARIGKGHPDWASCGRRGMDWIGEQCQIYQFASVGEALKPWPTRGRRPS
jgi:UDP-N-acetylglucosamine acyltransferase